MPDSRKGTSANRGVHGSATSRVGVVPQVGPSLGLVSVAAVAVGVAVAFGAWAVVAVTLLPMLVAVGVRWPPVGLVMLVGLSTDLLGIIAGEKAVRLFGLADAPVVAVVLSIAFAVLTFRRGSLRGLPRADRAVLLLLCTIVILAVVRALGTAIEYDFTVQSTLAAARRYALYLLPFGVIALVLRAGSVRHLTKVFLVLSSAYSAVVVVSWFAGGFGESPAFAFHVVEGMARTYPSAYWFSLAGAALSFAHAVGASRVRDGAWATMAAALCSAAIVSTGSRAAMLALLVSFVASLVLSRGAGGNRVGRNSSRMVAVVLAVVGVWLAMSAFGFAGRFGDLGRDLSAQGGTGAYRIAESQFRLAMVAKSPVFGVGFVPYDLSGTVAQGYGGITHLETVDSGLMTLLVNFGASGMLLLSALSFSFWVGLRRRLLFPPPSTVWIAVAGYLAGGLVTIPTQGHFAFSAGIAVTSVMIGLALGESTTVHVKDGMGPA